MIIEKKVKKILKKADAKSIAILSSGVMIAQIISVILQPIATRLYTPADYGVLSLIISISTMFVPFATFQYHMSIVNAEDDKEVNTLCKLNLIITIITSIILTIGFLLIKFLNLNLYKTTGNWIYMGVIFYFFQGLINIVDSYNNRNNEYKLMASVSMRRSLVSGIMKIIFGFFNIGILGLIISQIFSIIAGIKIQSKAILIRKREIYYSSIEEMKRVAIKYKHQPFFSLPGIFVVQFSYSILPTIINPFFGTTEGGFFSLSMTMLGIPLSLISDNVARVFFKNAAKENKEKGNFKSTFLNTSAVLILLSILGFGVLWFVSEPLFALVFGQRWLRSGTFVKLLIPMYAARFIVTGLMHGFIITDKQLLKVILQSFFMIEVIIINYLTQKYILSIEIFLSLVNWCYFFTYIILYIALYSTSKGQRSSD